jgi:hypothetical protein
MERITLEYFGGLFASRDSLTAEDYQVVLQDMDCIMSDKDCAALDVYASTEEALEAAKEMGMDVPQGPMAYQ